MKDAILTLWVSKGRNCQVVFLKFCACWTSSTKMRKGKKKVLMVRCPFSGTQLEGLVFEGSWSGIWQGKYPGALFSFFFSLSLYFCSKCAVDIVHQ